MPEFLEKALEKGAKKKGFTGRRRAEYVYGAMNNLGAMHGNKETAKGAAMERKHERDQKGGKVADHTKHGHPPHEVKGHHKIAHAGKQASGGPGHIKDGHESLMHDQRVTHDGLHAAGHTKRHTFHGIRHKDHHSKMQG